MSINTNNYTAIVNSTLTENGKLYWCRCLIDNYLVFDFKSPDNRDTELIKVLWEQHDPYIHYAANLFSQMEV